jgi:hypothetical protein
LMKHLMIRHKYYYMYNFIVNRIYENLKGVFRYLSKETKESGGHEHSLVSRSRSSMKLTRNFILPRESDK